MHILVSVLGALGMIVLVLWRIRQASQIASDVAEVAGSARGAVRRWRWRRKLNVNPIDLIEDAREAASVIMVAVAQADGLMSDVERTAITGEIEQRFGATPEQAVVLLARTQWMVRDGVDAAEIMRRLRPLLERTCSKEQLRELIEMLSAVATADGRHDELATFDIYRFAKKLGV